MVDVLIVDDHPAIREALTEMIGSLGHAVRSADGEREALEEIACKVPDLVLMDTSMPGSPPGYEICRRLKESYPRVHVIGMSTGSEYAALWRRNHADEFLTKPMRLEDLEEAIGRINI